MAIRRILSCNRSFYFDDSNGASVANRALMECLARQGFVVEAHCGTCIDAGLERDPTEALAGRSLAFEATGGGTADGPPRLTLTAGGVAVTVPHRPLKRHHDPVEGEVEGFLRLFDAAVERLRPDVLVTYGGDPLTREVLARARKRGIATVFTLHNFLYRHPGPFADADAVLVASEFSERFHRAALGLDCTVLPNLIDWDRARAERTGPGYVTFVNPSVEKGVYAFARIADELGRRRPEIPLLVVEGRGTEATLVGCGLDLKARGNVHLMAHTPDPRDFWAVTRVALLPSLWWENQPLVAIEAMLNGIPVVASDRGGLPETVGDGGIVLPLSERITPATRLLPTAEEVAPWVEAVIRLWDDADHHAERSRRARVEAERWRPDRLESRYVEFFERLSPGQSVVGAGREARARWAVLVPFVHAIEPDCDESLRHLERAGVTVVRCRGSSAIDVVRNTLASEALRRDCEAILFVDADVGFDPWDALRLLARPEPVVAGVYLKKGKPELASIFAPGIGEVTFGPAVPGPYPLEYAAAGFLRIRAEVLRRMIAELDLPLCDTDWGEGVWPFFLPMIVGREGTGAPHYLSEDYAFSHRLHQIGVTPMADTSIRLHHIGPHGYTWEDAAPTVRSQHHTFRFGGMPGAPP